MAAIYPPSPVHASPEYFRPGQHSHNLHRRDANIQGRTAIRFVRTLLLCFGITAAGYYCYTLGDQYVYQAYENWAFDQQIAGRRGVTFMDYIRAKVPSGLLPVAPRYSTTEPAKPASPAEPRVAPPVEGALLGRLQIERLNVSAMVRQGVDAKMLSVAIGHVPSTALAGQPGNFAVAAHRDTLFRALKDIRKGDLVTFESAGSTYTYKVLATKIVQPSDVSVLSPDGGGLIPAAAAGESDQPAHLLTMITCYPFYYVGSAPKRFIVQGELVPNPPSAAPQHAS